MTLLDREFVADFFRVFLGLFAVMAILFFASVLLDFYEELFASENSGIYWAGVYFAYRLPKFFVESGVVLVAASILWNVMVRARSNEILAYLAGGISPVRLALPFLSVALLVSIGNLALTEYVIGQSERSAKYVEERWIKNKSVEGIDREESIYQLGQGGRLYVIDAYDGATNTMYGATIVNPRPESSQPEWILKAREAELVSDEDERPVWEFHDATLREFDVQGQLVAFRQFGRVLDSQLRSPMEPKLREFLSNLENPDRMTIRELANYIKVLDSQGKQISEYRLMMHSKIALPLAVFVVAVLMCAHALRPKAAGVLLSFGGGLLFIALYYGVFLLSTRLAKADLGISPVFIAWFPNLLFSALGVIMLLRASR